MANTLMGSVNMKFVNCRKAAPDAGGSDSDLATPANYGSINSMRTRLAAANGAYYTAVRLDEMTVNDMVYALRTIDDTTSIAQ